MILMSSNGASSTMQFVIVLVIFVIVLAVTLWTTRWIAGYQKERMSGANMEIIDTMRISGSQYMQIVRIGEGYFAIAVSKDSVTKIAEIPEEQISIRPRSRDELISFKELLEKSKQLKKEDKNE